MLRRMIGLAAMAMTVHSIETWLSQTPSAPERQDGGPDAAVERHCTDLAKRCAPASCGIYGIRRTWYRRSAKRSPTNTECKLMLLTHAFEQLRCIAVEFRTHY
jgi:hypothetical protein